MGREAVTLADRFTDKMIPEPMSGCWLWTAATDGRGYGVIGIGRRVFKAHRISWLLHRGPVPDGMDVLHRCDTPPCVNPDHLWLGTAKDNAADMVAKGRGRNRVFYGDQHWSRRRPERVPRGDRNGARLHPERMCRGERQGSAKLTAEDVIAIRAEYLGLRGQQSTLANKYGISRKHLVRIAAGESWRHV